MSSPAETTAKATPKKKGGRKLLWTLVAVCVLGGGGGGGWWWWQSRQAADHPAPKKAGPTRAPALYVALEPAFVVNLTDDDAVRYLQADVQVVTRDADTRQALEQHAPAIRNRLLLLFGQQSSAQLGQRAGKERLQASALNEVRQVLRAEAAADRIEAVIFTSLVTQ